MKFSAADDESKPIMLTPGKLAIYQKPKALMEVEENIASSTESRSAKVSQPCFLAYLMSNATVFLDKL